MKHKYTIVYSERFMTGSHTNSITRYDRIETDDLATFITQDKYDGAVWFVFDGWPLEPGEMKVKE